MPRNNKDFVDGRMPLSKDIDRAWVQGKITGQEAQDLSDSNPHMRGKYQYNSSSEEQITKVHKKAGLTNET